MNPKVVVLLAGTNNVGDQSHPGDTDAKVKDVTRGLTQILRTIQAKAPAAKIIIMGIFPRNDNLAAIPLVNAINKNLATLADGQNVRYLNINDKLADSRGNLLQGMMNADRLHPAEKGYQVWADSLKPVLREWLGEPAGADHTSSGN